MKMWLNVDVRLMCPEHLKREVREIKQLPDIVRGEWDVPTWEGDGSTAHRKLRAHAEDGQIDTRRIPERWNALWDELDRRGLSLDIDREMPEWPDTVPHIYAGAPDDVGNGQYLAAKCPTKCAARMEADV